MMFRADVHANAVELVLAALLLIVFLWSAFTGRPR